MFRPPVVLFFTFISFLTLPLDIWAQVGDFTYAHGGIIRADQRHPRIALVFTAHEYAEGGEFILKALQDNGIKASFFFTGEFCRKQEAVPLIQKVRNQGHYLGAHSDQHLLYCDWEDRQRLLVDKATFVKDVTDNYSEMRNFGINEQEAKYFLPPYEWYNDSISRWTEDLGLTLVNFSPGTRSNADYTTPDMANYVDSETIFKQILAYEKQNPYGLNGFILLLHLGVGPKRTDKFHLLLPDLLRTLKARNYSLVRIDELLEPIP